MCKYDVQKVCTPIEYALQIYMGECGVMVRQVTGSILRWPKFAFTTRNSDSISRYVDFEMHLLQFVFRGL